MLFMRLRVSWMFIYLLRKKRKLKYILVFNIEFGDLGKVFLLYSVTQFRLVNIQSFKIIFNKIDQTWQ